VENQIEARTGAVLGATTQGTLNQLEKADLNVPAAPTQPYKIHFDQSLPESSRAMLVYDLKTGKILLDRNSDLKLQTASLTKLMTAIVASAETDFSKPIEIANNDHSSVKPVLGLKNADLILPEDLVKAMLVGSANDAAITLANHFGGQNQFVEKMNAKALELGMVNSHFDNPVGFDSANNYSTANDLRKLTDFAIAKLPFDLIWKTNNLQIKSALGNSYFIKNSNTLVSHRPDIKSIKTGLTPLALGNMIVEAQNAKGDQIVSINLGAINRNSSTLEEVDYIFSSFEWK
jgi:D-alanyl-D-alanine carboxypeptidase (penicillin-binding protein 5/6)